MAKKNIALLTGGDSGEYVISMKSSTMIRENLDKELFSVYTILIHKGKWVHVDDEGNECPVDKNDFTVRLSDQKLVFDCVFITIHGTPGEDGKLQAYFELLRIPYTTAGVLASALTFNKYYCNLIVEKLGHPVPRSVKLIHGKPYAPCEVIDQLGLPVFVKPNEGGSSLGMTFVKGADALQPAISHAFDYDRIVLVEEYISGVELTCGVFLQDGRIRALPLTEIISKTAARYFDYEAKYTPGAADEITPARITPELTTKVQEVSVELYEQLDLFGLVRFDYIYNKANDSLYFIEVNVTPGMTETSLVPQAAAVAGISNKDLFTTLIEEALRKSKP